MLTEAIQQLQIAQKNPHRRIQSHYFLGICFEQKHQYDMAIEQLELAASESIAMDSTKKEIYYQLGLVSETMKNPVAARKYFKEIYQADISYRDVAQRVEKSPAS